MSKILIVNWSLISLILTWSWHIKVLVALPCHLNAHVELRICFSFLEVTINFVSCWGRCEVIRAWLLLSNGSSYLNSMVYMCGVIWGITLRSYWLCLLYFIQILVISLAICVGYDAEPRQMCHILAIVCTWSWHSIISEVLCLVCASQE